MRLNQPNCKLFPGSRRAVSPLWPQEGFQSLLGASGTQTEAETAGLQLELACA